MFCFYSASFFSDNFIPIVIFPDDISLISLTTALLPNIPEFPWVSDIAPQTHSLWFEISRESMASLETSPELHKRWTYWPKEPIQQRRLNRMSNSKLSAEQETFNRNAVSPKCQTIADSSLCNKLWH